MTHLQDLWEEWFKPVLGIWFILKCRFLTTGSRSKYKKSITVLLSAYESYLQNRCADVTFVACRDKRQPYHPPPLSLISCARTMRVHLL